MVHVGAGEQGRGLAAGPRRNRRAALAGVRRGVMRGCPAKAVCGCGPLTGAVEPAPCISRVRPNLTPTPQPPNPHPTPTLCAQGRLEGLRVQQGGGGGAHRAVQGGLPAVRHHDGLSRAGHRQHVRAARPITMARWAAPGSCYTGLAACARHHKALLDALAAAPSSLWPGSW